MSSTTNLVCITCPRGCSLTATTDDNGEISVTGNFCKRGEMFAKAELTRPMRTICSTVRTTIKEAPVLPCRVSSDIPKDKIFDVMAEINKVVVDKKMVRGDVIIPNVLDLGVDVIATSDLLSEI